MNNKCGFCEKEIKQPEGKRVKLFCNNTCRSNYWYKLNKKGKVAAKKKVLMPPKENKNETKEPPPQYKPQVLSNFLLSRQKLKTGGK